MGKIMKQKLLIVDDEQSILRALKRLFMRVGYQVFIADNGKEALEIMSKEACPVVISDYRMPMMNGSDLLLAIKSMQPNTVCMVLSGSSDFNSILTLLNSRTVFRFLQKPWDDNALVIEVEKAFCQYHSKQQRSIIADLLASSDEAVIELFPHGQIGRFNGLSKKILAIRNENTLLNDLFPYCTDRCIDYLFSPNVETPTLQTTQGESVMFSLKHVTDNSRFFSISMASDVDNNVLCESKTLIDQTSLLSTAQTLLETDKSFALVAIHLKNYGYWADMLGDIDSVALFNEIHTTLIMECERFNHRISVLPNEYFVILVANYVSEIELHSQLDNIFSSFTDKKYAEKTVRIEFTISYCIAPSDGASAQQLFSNALVSNRLHSNGNSHFYMRFDDSIIEQKRKQLFTSKALYHAIENQELFLNFQPKYDLRLRKIASCEVLLRWNSPELGMVSPDVFIPIAEQEGQIIEIGYWVIEKTCLAISNWLKNGIVLDHVAVNISGKQLSEPDFIPRVEALLKGFDIDMSILEFELTESWLVDNIEESAEKLARLKKAGISIAIDDFGTGYSSLSYLSKLPIDVLKIDRSLIIDIASNLNTQSMIANITRMAHDLGMKVVVEGVEYFDQIPILERLNCDIIQGYVIARPQKEEQFISLISDPNFSVARLMGDL